MWRKQEDENIDHLRSPWKEIVRKRRSYVPFTRDLYLVRSNESCRIIVWKKGSQVFIVCAPLAYVTSATRVRTIKINSNIIINSLLEAPFYCRQILDIIKRRVLSEIYNSSSTSTVHELECWYIYVWVCEYEPVCKYCALTEEIVLNNQENRSVWNFFPAWKTAMKLRHFDFVMRLCIWWSDSSIFIVHSTVTSTLQQPFVITNSPFRIVPWRLGFSEWISNMLSLDCEILRFVALFLSWARLQFLFRLNCLGRPEISARWWQQRR